MYLKQRPKKLEKINNIARIQSIEGIVTTSTRIAQLVEEKTMPKNRDEQEIAGYRDAFKYTHESFDAIPISRNYIPQLYKILYSHMNNPMAGQIKNTQNYISATKPDGSSRILFRPLSPFERRWPLTKFAKNKIFVPQRYAQHCNIGLHTLVILLNFHLDLFVIPNLSSQFLRLLSLVDDCW